MSKASILAVTVVAALSLSVPAMLSAVAPAIGQSSSYTPPPPSSTPPGNPGDPSTPPGGGGGSGGNGGDLPTPPEDEQIAKLEESCNAALSALVKIPVKMVEGFQGGGVTVVPVCNAGLGHSVNIDASQALPLQGAIADNSALSGPLTSRGFKPDNVVGVVLIDGNATLYVHTGA